MSREGRKGYEDRPRATEHEAMPAADHIAYYTLRA